MAMRRSRLTEGQIIGVLKDHQAAAAAPDPCRRHGPNDATPCKWRAKNGGMEVSGARKMKSLEDENVRLKKSRAESMLDVSALRWSMTSFASAWRW